MPDYIDLLKAVCTREEFPPKTMLVKEGTVAKNLFFIETGCCRCWFITDEGKEITMSFGFEGNFASSMETIISGEPSWYSVEALEPMVVYSMPIAEFKERKANSNEFRAAYYAHVEIRLLHYQKLFVSRIKDSPEKRYKDLLEHHPEVILRVPQHYIASFLGITSVSLSRIRNRR